MPFLKIKIGLVTIEKVPFDSIKAAKEYVNFNFEHGREKIFIYSTVNDKNIENTTKLIPYIKRSWTT